MGKENSFAYYENLVISQFPAFNGSTVQMPYIPASLSDVRAAISDNGYLMGAVVGLIGMAYLYSKRRKNQEDEDLLAEEFGEGKE